MSELRSARPNFDTLYYFTIYCCRYGHVGLSADTFGVEKKIHDLCRQFKNSKNGHIVKNIFQNKNKKTAITMHNDA